MPPAKKRKTAPTADQAEIAAKENGSETSKHSETKDSAQLDDLTSAEPPSFEAPVAPAADKNKERQERFKALQVRAVSDSKSRIPTTED